MFISCHVVKFTNIDTDFVLRLAHVPERPDVQRVLVMKFAHIEYTVLEVKYFSFLMAFDSH